MKALERMLTRFQGSVLVLLAGAIFCVGPLTFRAGLEADAWQYLFHRALGTAVVAALVIGIGGRNPITAIRRSGPRQQLAGVLLATLFGIFVVALSMIKVSIRCIRCLPVVSAVRCGCSSKELVTRDRSL